MTRRLTHIRLGILLVAAITASTACSSSNSATVNVYVASSLAEAFEKIESDYEKQTPNVDIRLNVAGSSTLLRQIEAGASVDVFAPADVAIFNRLTKPPTRDVERFALNTLTLVVPTEPDAQPIDSVDDLFTDDIIVARCAAGVPCGAVTDNFLQNNDIDLSETSEHLNVSQVVEHVASGEAGAGFVYQTDAVRTTDRTRAIPLENAPTVSPAIAAISDEPEAARFAQYVTSKPAQTTFVELGFDLAG